MGHPFFGAGFFPASTPPPEAYTALVAYFGGDADAANMWLADWQAYATSAEAVELLATLEGVGDPEDAIAALGLATPRRAVDLNNEYAPPIPGLAVAVPATPLAGMPARAPTYT
jgi:hypothetical protein